MADIQYLTVDHLSTKDLIRIFSKISIDPAISWNGTPCWTWNGTRKKRGGYGVVCWHSCNYSAHRFMFAWLVHALPKSQVFGELDHLCRRASCCNPLHQDFVTTRTNVLRSNAPAAINARKTHCDFGHALTPENIYANKKGHRFCRACTARRSKERRKSQDESSRLKKNERLRMWRATNKAHVNAQQLEYAAKHKEQRAEYRKQRLENNRDEINAKARAYAAANRDKINERQRKWRAEHPEKYKEQTRRNNASYYARYRRAPMILISKQSS